MKIKRYTARDMRQAMQKVREDQGPDAVILSSRRSDGMVEIVAAIDYDEALVREAVEPLRGERNEARVVTQPVAEVAQPTNATHVAKVATPEVPKPAARPQARVAVSVAALTKTSAPSPKVAPIATAPRVAEAPAPAPRAETPATDSPVSAAEARAALEASAERLRMRDEI